MAGLTSHMTKHLRSAKQWLTRAEESFDKDSNIRGELDLFLAQAELQHAREANYSRQGRYKYPLIRHALSFVLAASVVAVAFGAYWLSGERSVAVPHQPVVQEAGSIALNNNVAPAEPVKAIVEESQQVAVVNTTVSSSQVVVPTFEHQAKTEVPNRPEKENILQPDEMRKIVQVAGRSLRGQ